MCSEEEESLVWMLISVWAAALQQSAVELQTKIHKGFTISDNVSTKAFSWMKALILALLAGTFSVIVKSSRTFVCSSSVQQCAAGQLQRRITVPTFSSPLLQPAWHCYTGYTGLAAATLTPLHK